MRAGASSAPTLERRQPQRYRSFADAETRKITPSRSSAVNSPVIAASACCAPRSSSAKSSSGGGAACEMRAAASRCVAARRAARAGGARARGTCPPCPRARRRPRAWPRASSSTPAPVLRRKPHVVRAAPSIAERLRRRSPARSILLWTTMRAQRRRQSREDRGVGGVDRGSRASVTISARSARAIAAHVRSMPMRSIGSARLAQARGVDDVQRNAANLDRCCGRCRASCRRSA